MEKEKPNKQHLAGAIMVIIVSIISYDNASSWISRDYQILFRPTATRLGAITEVEKYGGNGNMKYTYRFVVNENEFIKEDTVEYKPEGPHKVGDSVWVRYNIKNPNYSTIRSTKWVIWLFLALVALWIGAIVSFVYLVIRFRRWVKEKKKNHKET